MITVVENEESEAKKVAIMIELYVNCSLILYVYILYYKKDNVVSVNLKIKTFDLLQQRQ